MSTLSVEISTMASSIETLSPTFFNQRVIVPSVTDSPSCGNKTFTVDPLAAGAATGCATGVGAGACTTGFSITGSGFGAGGGVCTTGALTTGALTTGALGATDPDSPMIAITPPTGITAS